MEKEFVPYELAVKLKELGFKRTCLANYVSGTYGFEKVVNTLEIWNDEDVEILHSKIKAPLWQQAFDWFREKYNLHALNSPLLNNEWSVVIDNALNSNQVYWSKRLGYEEARKACLEKLIEICKNHQYEI